MDDQKPVKKEKDSDQALAGSSKPALTGVEFHGLAQVSAEAEWFANIENKQTRRAYQACQTGTSIVGD